MCSPADQASVQEALDEAKAAVKSGADLANALASLEDAGKTLTSVMLYDVSKLSSSGPPEKK